MTDNDVIEVVTFHVLSIGSVTFHAILACGRIAIQSKASFAEKIGNSDRVEAEGPRFSQLCDIVEDLRQSFKTN